MKQDNKFDFSLVQSPEENNATIRHHNKNVFSEPEPPMNIVNEFDFDEDATSSVLNQMMVLSNSEESSRAMGSSKQGGTPS